MTITFKELLKGQSDNNLIDIMNETLIAIEDQKKYYPDQLLALNSFNSRLDKVYTELESRGLK